MKLFTLIVLILAGCVVAQQKAPTAKDFENNFLIKATELTQEYNGCMVGQENLVAQIQAYADTVRMYQALRDSIKAIKAKK